MYFLHLFDPVLHFLLWSMVPATPCYTGTQCLSECDSLLYIEASPEPGCEDLCTNKYRNCSNGCKFMPKEKRNACFLDCIYNWSECDKACKRRKRNSLAAQWIAFETTEG